MTNKAKLYIPVVKCVLIGKCFQSTSGVKNDFLISIGIFKVISLFNIERHLSQKKRKQITNLNVPNLKSIYLILIEDIFIIKVS